MTVRGGCIPQLSLFIRTPCDCCAIGAKRHTVISTRAYSLDHFVFQRTARGRIHRRGECAFCGAAVAQLALVIQTPSKHCAVGAQNQKVKGPRSNGHHRFGCKRTARTIDNHRLPIVRSAAPSHHRAIQAKRRVLRCPGRDGHHHLAVEHAAAITQYIHRYADLRRLPQIRGIAQLPRTISPPCRDSTIGTQRQRVVLAACHLDHRAALKHS